jgi:hypothetical protein
MVPIRLTEKIVKLIAHGKADKAEAQLKAIKPFSDASHATREASMGIMGYLLSLAPVRAVSTRALLTRMINLAFAAAVLATASRDGTALMPRIADLAASETGVPVADVLLEKLRVSIHDATVNGAPMYGPKDAKLDAHIKEIVERLKRKERFEKPPSSFHPFLLQEFVRSFLLLSADERINHMRTYGPMCLWDVSRVANFSAVCDAKPLTAEPPTYLTFNSDLFWDTSAATNMASMFLRNAEFRGDLSTWDVRNVQRMVSTFSGTGITDSGIGSWDVRSLEDATRMFFNTPLLSPKLDFSLWNMQNCKNLSLMFFKSAIEDNKIGKWILRSDANTTDMLKHAVSFTGDLPRAAAAVTAMPSFGTTRSVRTVGAQQTADITDVRKLFAKALSAQGTEQKKEKREKKEPEAGSCAMQ